MVTMELRRSGRMMAFDDLSIGEPFFAHDRVWIRTDYDAATVLGSAERYRMHSTCNFRIDECDKVVEAVDYFVAGERI